MHHFCSSNYSKIYNPSSDDSNNFNMELSFSTKTSTQQTYTAFIADLRRHLTTGRPEVHGIPQLPRTEDVPDKSRFLLVHLTAANPNPKEADQTITVAIDVVNVYVVGYAVPGHSYLLHVDPKEKNPPPIKTLFPKMARTDLSFDGTYGQLSKNGDTIAREILPDYTSKDNKHLSLLEQVRLGRNELDYAIRLLYGAKNQHSQAYGLVVVILMLSEVARFPYIEALLKTHMGPQNSPFVPEASTLTMIRQWSALSGQIQRVPAGGKNFPQAVELRSLKNEVMEVKDVNNKFVAQRGIAMLLYDTDAANLYPATTAGAKAGPSRGRGR